MINYSKGQWQIKKYSDGVYYIKTPDEPALVAGSILKKSNAALISAAPEMFEFILKMFIHSDNFNDKDLLEKTMIEAGDLIAKVIERGEQ